MIDRPTRDILAARNGAVNRSDGRTARRAGIAAPTTLSPPSSTVEGLLPVLWRHRWAVTISIVVALTAGAIYVQTATPVYESTARLYLDPTAIAISNPYEPGARPQTERYLYTQAQIIKSTPVIAAATNALMTQGLKTFSDIDIPSAYLQKHLQVNVGKKDDVISVSFKSAYPHEAAAIVNRVVDAYRESRSERGKTDNTEVLEIQKEDLANTFKELTEKRNELREFQKNATSLSLQSGQGGGAVMQRFLDIQAQYTQAQDRLREAAAFRKSVQDLVDEPAVLRQYLQNKGKAVSYPQATAERTLLESRAVELQLKRKTLSETFTGDHPRIAGLSLEIEQIERNLAALDHDFVATVLTAAEQEYLEAQSYSQELAAAYADQLEQAKKVTAEDAQYLWLKDEVDRLRIRHAKLDDDVRDLTKIVGEDVQQLRVALLEPAAVAKTPSEPRKGRIMAFALVLGMLLGGGIAVGRDWLNQTLRSADEISSLLRVSVLGAVPAMSRRQKLRDRGQKVLLQPDSHEAEAFRTIRTAVFFGAPKEKTKTMVVTSPSAGDGKSTLVSNLAIAMACAGQKTLVLDADFRRPTQHLIFEVDYQQRCLSEVLDGRMSLGAAIQQTQTKGLHVLTCGHGIANPAEVLNGEVFSRLLTSLLSTYDRILIDAPPVTLVTDAQILGALSDVTVLVLRADKSTRRAAQRALDALQSVGSHLLGVVVNEVHRTGDRYGYYYGQYRKYGTSGSGNGRGDKSKSRATAEPSSKDLPLETAAKGAKA